MDHSWQGKTEVRRRHALPPKPQPSEAGSLEAEGGDDAVELQVASTAVPDAPPQVSNAKEMVPWVSIIGEHHRFIVGSSHSSYSVKFDVMCVYLQLV